MKSPYSVSLLTMLETMLLAFLLMGLISLFPQIAFMVACSIPMALTAWWGRKVLLTKHLFLVFLSSLFSLIPLGVLFHAICYVSLGSQVVDSRNGWVISIALSMDAIYLSLIEKVFGWEASMQYLFFLDWCYVYGSRISGLTE